MLSNIYSRIVSQITVKNSFILYYSTYKAWKKFQFIFSLVIFFDVEEGKRSEWVLYIEIVGNVVTLPLKDPQFLGITLWLGLPSRNFTSPEQFQQPSSCSTTSMIAFGAAEKGLGADLK